MVYIFLTILLYKRCILPLVCSCSDQSNDAFGFWNGCPRAVAEKLEVAAVAAGAKDPFDSSGQVIVARSVCILLLTVTRHLIGDDV
jgi:hypothetical protein